MGACICMDFGNNNRLDLEDNLSSLINSLLIRKISNTVYLELIKIAYSKTNNIADLKKILKQYLKPTDINNMISTDELNTLVEKLNEIDTILLAFSLIFLTHQIVTNSISVEKNYYEFREIFKSKFEYLNDFELINLILKFYGDFITIKMLNIYLFTKRDGSKKEDILFLENLYTKENIEEYLLNFFNENKKDFHTERIFVDNLIYLEHEIFSENLKNFFEQKKK